MNGVKEYFDKLYENNHFYLGNKESFLIRHITRSIPRDQIDNSDRFECLELGGGVGRDAVALAKKRWVSKVLIMDISDRAIEKGNKVVSNDTKIAYDEKLRDVCTEWPMDFKFDLIYSYNLLHFIPNDRLEDLFREINRHLKPNGWTYHMFLANPFNEERSFTRTYIHSHSNTKLQKLLNTYRNMNIQELCVYENHSLWKVEGTDIQVLPEQSHLHHMFSIQWQKDGGNN